MALRNSILAVRFYRIVDTFLLPVVGRVMKSPKQCTLAGLLLAGFVPIGFYGHPFFGFLFITLSGLIDAVDGEIARKTGNANAYGAFLDSTVDRISDFFYLMGFWGLFWKHPRWGLAGILIFLALLFTFLISYVKARAEGLGGQCRTGWMERGWRTLYLIVWSLLLCLVPSAFFVILWSGLVILCVLTLVTVCQRIASVQADLDH